MSTEGSIKAADLLDEKALIVFEELNELVKENIASIEKLKRNNILLGNTVGKTGAISIKISQQIKANLTEIDELEKKRINKNLELLSIQERSASKRNKVAADEAKIEADRLKAINKREAEEAKALKNKKAEEAKYYAWKAKMELDGNKAWKNAVAYAATLREKEKNAVIRAEKAKRAARRASMQALTVGMFAAYQIAIQFLAVWNKLVNVMVILDSFRHLMLRVTGSLYDAAESMNYLIKASRAYGVSLKETTSRYSKFFAAAKQAGLELTKIRDIFTSVSKVSGILSLKGDEVRGVFLALEQMLSKGKVTTEELRRQLGERLPGAFGIMANAAAKAYPELDITVFTLDKFLKKGQIVSSEVLPEFARQLEIAFNATQVEKVETLVAATENLKSSYLEFIYTLESGGSGLSNFLRGVYDGLTGNIDAMTKMLKLSQATADEMERIGELRNKLSGFSKPSSTSGAVAEGALGSLGTMMKLIKSQYISMDEYFQPEKYKQIREELEKAEQAVIARVDYEQKNLLLQQDYLNMLIAEMLNVGQLKTDKEIMLASDQLKLAATKLTNEQLIKIIHNHNKINEIKRQEEKLTEGTVDWYEYKIKLLKAEITAKLTMTTYTEEENKALLDGLKIKEEELRLLKIALGLGKVKAKTRKEEEIFEIGTLAWYDKIISQLEKQIKTTIDLGEASGEEYEAMRKALALNKARKKELEDMLAIRKEMVALEAKGVKFQTGSIKDISNKISELKAKTEALGPGNESLITLYKIEISQLEAQLKLLKTIGDVQVDNMDDKASEGMLDRFEGSAASGGDIFSKLFSNRAKQDAKYRQEWANLNNGIRNDDLVGYAEFLQDKIDLEGDYNKKVFDASIELMNQSFALGDAIFDRRIENLQAEMDALEISYDRKIELASNDEEKQRDLEKEKQARLEIIRRKELEEQQKQAKLQKAQAITNAVINTAVAVTAMLGAGPGIGIALAAITAAIGAVEIATIIATPIPQYKKGRKGGKEELAITGDGGVSEYIVGKRGIAKTPNKPTLTYLEKGDSVLKDDKALKMMLAQTLLKDTGISFTPDNKGMEDAVERGIKKAKINNFIKMPDIKVDLDHQLWLYKKSQF